VTEGAILFFATGVAGSVGGIASANRNVLAALKRIGEDEGRPVLTFVLGERGGEQPDYRTFGGRQGHFALAVLASLPRAAIAVFDHAHLARPILALPRGFGPPIVICAHGSEASRRLRPSSARVYRRADLVLTNSSFTLERMRGAVARFRGVACPLGLPPQFEVARTRPKPSTEAVSFQAADGCTRPLGQQAILLVARMDAGEREKGHRELLTAMPTLLERHPDAQLVFVGDGSDLADLSALAAASTAAKSIFLTGRLPDALLTTIYGRAAVFAMPSRQEGFGLVYLEAMNHAKPCIACRDDGGSDVVVDGETGLLVSQAFDTAELVGALDRLLGDPALAAKLGEGGWRRLVNEFTAAAHQERLGGFIRPLMQPGRRHPGIAPFDHSPH
jgi:phosphatidylinositol alpha-1,6-mannosyltransferase